MLLNLPFWHPSVAAPPAFVSYTLPNKRMLLFAGENVYSDAARATPAALGAPIWHWGDPSAPVKGVQPDAGARPINTATGPSFDGIQSLMNLAGLYEGDPGQSCSGYVVFTPTRESGVAGVIGTDTSLYVGTNVNQGYVGNFGFNNVGRAINGVPGGNGETVHVYWTWDGSNMIVGVQGLERFHANHVGAMQVADAFLGTYYSFTNLYRFQGTIQAAIVCKGTWSAATRAALRLEMNYRFPGYDPEEDIFVLVGNSIMAGYGANATDVATQHLITLPWLIEQKLKTRDLKVKVIVYGFPNIPTDQLQQNLSGLIDEWQGVGRHVGWYWKETTNYVNTPGHTAAMDWGFYKAGFDASPATMRGIGSTAPSKRDHDRELVRMDSDTLTVAGAAAMSGGCVDLRTIPQIGYPNAADGLYDIPDGTHPSSAACDPWAEAIAARYAANRITYPNPYVY